MILNWGRSIGAKTKHRCKQSSYCCDSPAWTSKWWWPCRVGFAKHADKHNMTGKESCMQLYAPLFCSSLSLQCELHCSMWTPDFLWERFSYSLHKGIFLCHFIFITLLTWSSALSTIQTTAWRCFFYVQMPDLSPVLKRLSHSTSQMLHWAYCISPWIWQTFGTKGSSRLKQSLRLLAL